MRLAGLQPDVKASITANAIKEHQDEIKNNFMVITAETVRIRKRESL